MAEKIGLICEGGGTKIAYTCRVLQCFLNYDTGFSYTVRINAGAEVLLPFITGQEDRLRVIGVDVACESGAIDVLPLIHKRGVFDISYVYKLIKKHAPLDYEAFTNNKTLLNIGVYNTDTNEVEYFPEGYFDPKEQILMQANCALLLLTQPYEFRGHMYMDTELIDMIPTEQSTRQGNMRHVFISTREENYVRKPASGWQIWLVKLMYLGDRTVRRNLEIRHISYWEQWQIVKGLEEQGNATVLRPSADCGVIRCMHGKEPLGHQLDLGYEDTKNRLDMIRGFMEK